VSQGDLDDVLRRARVGLEEFEDSENTRDVQATAWDRWPLWHYQEHTVSVLLGRLPSPGPPPRMLLLLSRRTQPP
jgi:hypothetical protein